MKSIRRYGKDGIALIIVLGFLSLLLILAISFSITMRMERLTARNYIYVVKAKNVARLGMARTMSDINESMLTPSFKVFPANDILISKGSISSTNCTDLLSLAAKYYVPKAVWSVANANAANVEWTNVYDSVSSELVGRFAYMVVDCSGYADVNYIGGVKRGYGINANEIVAAAVTNSTTVGCFSELNVTNCSPDRLGTNNALIRNLTIDTGTTNETPWVRLETLAEFNRLGRKYSETSNMVFRSKAAFASDLFTFSYFPTGFLDASSGYTVNSQVDLSGDDGVLSGNTDIVPELSSIGFEDPQSVFLNLLDYVDSNNLPRSVSTFCTEAVPLINEVVVQTSYTTNMYDPGTGTNVLSVTNQYQIICELWYPFLSYTNTENFTLAIGAKYVGGSSLPSGMTPSNMSDTVSISKNWSPNSYLSVTSMLQRTDPKLVFPTGTVFNFNKTEIQLSVYLTNTLSSQVVDLTTNLTFDLSIITQPKTLYSVGVAANDPRFNWDGSATSHWVHVDTTNITPDAFNSYSYMTNEWSDDVTKFYVKNAPLETVGELGLLCYDTNRPWTTIRLEGADINDVTRRVVDRFTVTPNRPPKGYINPNTLSSNALSAVFYNTPVEAVPGNLNTNVSLQNAIDLADVIIQNGPYMNLSDICTNSFASLTDIATNSYERESIIRNSLGLFSIRQNLFTIILAAQSLDSKTNVLAEQRAVALVWRDPYPDSQNHHDMFVRFFKWLDE